MSILTISILELSLSRGVTPQNFVTCGWLNTPLQCALLHDSYQGEDVCKGLSVDTNLYTLWVAKNWSFVLILLCKILTQFIRFMIKLKQSSIDNKIYQCTSPVTCVTETKGSLSIQINCSLWLFAVAQQPTGRWVPIVLVYWPVAMKIFQISEFASIVAAKFHSF